MAHCVDWNPRNAKPMHEWLVAKPHPQQSARMAMLGNQVVPAQATLAFETLLNMRRCRLPFSYPKWVAISKLCAWHVDAWGWLNHAHTQTVEIKFLHVILNLLPQVFTGVSGRTVAMCFFTSTQSCNHSASWLQSKQLILNVASLSSHWLTRSG